MTGLQRCQNFTLGHWQVWQEQFRANSSVKSQDYIQITWHLQHLGVGRHKALKWTTCANTALESQINQHDAQFQQSPRESFLPIKLFAYGNKVFSCDPMAPDLRLMQRHSWQCNSQFLANVRSIYLKGTCNTLVIIKWPLAGVPGFVVHFKGFFSLLLSPSLMKATQRDISWTWAFSLLFFFECIASLSVWSWACQCCYRAILAHYSAQHRHVVATRGGNGNYAAQECSNQSIAVLGLQMM